MSTVDRIIFSLFIEYECLVFSLGTSPPSAALWWNSGVLQSQKQRKRSKSSTSDESSSQPKGTEGNARDVTSDERKDKEAAPAWSVPLLSFIYLFIYFLFLSVRLCVLLSTVIRRRLKGCQQRLQIYFSFARGKGNGFYAVCCFKYTLFETRDAVDSFQTS